MIYLLVCGLACGAEALRWMNPESRLAALTGWLAGREANWLPFLPLLLTGPLWIRIPSPSRRAVASSPWQNWLNESAATAQRLRGASIAAMLLFVLGLSASRFFGSDLSGFPPAYHDEYSYLFQAETYLHGHWSFPSHPLHPEWFDQMHVLNEGRFASRYFPGVGLWMAPFVTLGNPWLGHQIAQGLAAMLIFWIGRELSSNGTGLLAGILCALSPGLILFSNLLLAHQPTLVGLLLFAWAFFRWYRCGGSALLLIAGGGLAFAMLCRPMTAAGFALPFGILFASWWLTNRPTLNWNARPTEQLPFWKRSVSAFALAAPLAGGLLILAISNQAITGSWRTTPYQLYTDIYTPRHRYGFENVTIGEQRLGPKVLDHYDRWAENLTPALAVKNTWIRLESSLRWSMGIVPLLLGGVTCLLTIHQGDRRWWLIGLSILSLHLAHVPYWFSGIMGWHYVFESAPLWILLFAEASHRLVNTWKESALPGLRWWWSTLIIITLGVNLVTFPPVWPGRIEQGMAELAFPRRRYQAFRQQVEELRAGRPAIVFVIPDKSDRHMDYVTNPPTLDGPVLIARIRDRTQLRAAAAAFPDRIPLIFDAAQRQLSILKISRDDAP